MKILFCTDGSHISLTAILNFSKWLKEFKTDILSVASIHTLPEGFVLEIPEFETKCQNSVDEILNYSKEFLLRHNIMVDKLIKGCGGIVDYILETEKKYDFLVLGSRSKKGIQKWLGTTSTEIANKSTSSIYISKGKNENKEILFVFQPEYDYEIELKKIIPKFNFNQKNIHLITVFEVPEYLFLEGNIDKKWINEIEKKQIKESLNKIAHYERIFSQHNIKILNSTAIKGNFAEEIQKYSQKKQIDLIVLLTNNQRRNKSDTSTIYKKILENCSSDIAILKDY